MVVKSGSRPTKEAVVAARRCTGWTTRAGESGHRPTSEARALLLLLLVVVVILLLVVVVALPLVVVVALLLVVVVVVALLLVVVVALLLLVVVVALLLLLLLTAAVVMVMLLLLPLPGRCCRGADQRARGQSDSGGPANSCPSRRRPRAVTAAACGWRSSR